MHLRRIFLCPLAALFSASCSLTEPVTQPDLPLPQTLGQGTSLTTESLWWQTFSDTQLNQLIDAGLQQNFSLQAAWAKLAQSRALWREAGAGQSPDLDLSLSKNREWQQDVTSGEWSAGLSASYEVDFWGRVAAADDKARFAALSSAAAVRTQANTVAAEITLNWYGQLMQQEKLRLLNDQRLRLEQALSVVRGRFQRGQTAISDVWQQEQLLEANRASVIEAGAALAAYRQQLALWTANSTALDLSSPVQTGALPAISAEDERVDMALLLRRPDVEAAWLNVQSANAGVAAAMADRYPRFTLSASYTGADQNLNQVFDNWVGKLAGSLVLPLIDGGNRRAVVAQNRALLEQNLATYQQTLLEAAVEVQQALLDGQAAAATLSSLQQQLELARKTEAFQDNRYRKGVGDFLSLLDARQDVLSLEQKVLDAHWTRLQQRIQLFRAVSHGDFLQKEASA